MKPILAAAVLIALVGGGVALSVPSEDEVCACSYGVESPPVLTLVPDRVRPGDQARLQVLRSPSTWGLGWTLERRQGSTWKEVGAFIGGPVDYRGKGRFYLGDKAKDLVVNDIGFTQPASVSLGVPALQPGTYRLGQGFITGSPAGDKTLHERTKWRYAVFEVVN